VQFDFEQAGRKVCSILIQEVIYGENMQQLQRDWQMPAMQRHRASRLSRLWHGGHIQDLLHHLPAVGSVPVLPGHRAKIAAAMGLGGGRSFHQGWLNRRSIEEHFIQEVKTMRLTFTAAMCFLLSITAIARAAGHFIPAGMPIGCWMQEKKLSLKTAEPGDPVLCYLSPSMHFGRPLFPHGSYLTGRIEGGKAPGRLHGKGTLVINFDRVVVSDSVRVPITVKVIAALKYKISPDGKIIGRGHAKRDLAAWAFSPLWPLDLMNLPRRGPWPAIKGKEERLLLRVMQDAIVPEVQGEIPYYASAVAPLTHRPDYYENPVHVGGDVVLIRKDGSAVYTIDYWYSVAGVVSYVLPGNLFGKMPLSELNLKETKRVNEQRGISFKIVR
jgi:hypothetical protein